MISKTITFAFPLSGPDIRQTRDPHGIPGRPGEPAPAGYQLAPGLPLGEDEGVPLHNSAPSHPRGDTLLTDQGSC